MIKNIRMLTIYLGNKCNFNCTYCDRDYINTLGGQALNSSSADPLKNFFEWVQTQDNKISYVSFHGGEPLLFSKRLEECLEWLAPICIKNDWKICITTNGSLVKVNEHIFEKYSGIFTVTVSYDFIYQELNRDALNIYEMAEVLNKHCYDWRWQYVLPIEDRAAFSFKNIQNIVETCYKTKCTNVNIVPLRHIRGKDKFNIIIDHIDLEQFFAAFLEFIQILYVKKINVFIDGNYDVIDKSYFSNHNKLILSPDGYIYPEFDFLEYKAEHLRIGEWQNDIQIWKDQGDVDKIHNSCQTCESKSSCGIKYLYKLFDKQPNGACKKFYKFIDVIIMHNSKLKQHKNLFETIGIDTSFKINNGKNNEF